MFPDIVHVARADRALLAPGLVPCAQWRPDQDGRGEAAPIVPLYASVARKP